MAPLQHEITVPEDLDEVNDDDVFSNGSADSNDEEGDARFKQLEQR